MSEKYVYRKGAKIAKGRKGFALDESKRGVKRV